MGESCRVASCPCAALDEECVLSTFANLYRKGASFMGTHSPSAEDRYDPPQPASAKEHTPLISQTLLRVLRRYENESLAEAWLIAQRWPNGVRCPECGSDDIAEPPGRIPMPYRCRSCRTQFSVKSHSVMRSSKLPMSIWVQALHICSALSNPDAVDIRDVLPVTNKSGWNLAMRIHESWEFRRSGERNRQKRRRP